MTNADRLAQLLRPDTLHLNRDDAWRELTAGFTECLHAFVADARRMSRDEADRYLAAYEEGIQWWRTDVVGQLDFPKEGGSTLSRAQVERQLAALDHLVRIARVTVRPFREVPDEEWALACRDWLEGRAGWSASVAVAGVGRDQGRVDTLRADVMPGGVGRLSRHPVDAAEGSPTDALFEESMRIAWQAAQEASEQRAAYDARYRLLEGPLAEHDAGETATNRAPVPSPTGASAAGAAARAWCYLLRGRKAVPDPGVVVMAGIARDGDGPFELTEVEHIDRKVAAVAEVNRARAREGPWLDTIVVASERNGRQAEEALQGSPDLGYRVRVVVEHDPRRLGPTA